MKRLFIAILIAGGAWHFATRNPQAVAIDIPPAHARITAPSVRDAPVQRSLGAGPVFRVGDHELRALAEFALTARVLSTERYRTGREARLSQIDLALGWGRMADPKVVERLAISQSGRWYHWRYEGAPPIPHREIERSSANMHLIAATPEVARTLGALRRGDLVSLTGYLVEAKGSDGWRWRSSLTRDDTGNGACELIFVQAVESGG